MGNPNYNGHTHRTNEDASIASVKRVRTLTRVPAKILNRASRALVDLANSRCALVLLNVLMD